MACSEIRVPAELGCSALHWLPVRAAESAVVEDLGTHNGFQQPYNDGTGGSSLEATLRGRQLRGCQATLPAGYRGVVLRPCSAEEATRPHGSSSSSSAMQGSAEDDHADANDGAGTRHWVASQAFTNITYWNHDSNPSKADPSRRALDWLEVARKVHAPVSAQDVQDKLQSLLAAKPKE